MIISSKTATLTQNSSSMAHLANLNGVSETLPAVPNLPKFQKFQKRAKLIGLLGHKAENFQDQAQITRRVSLGLASLALIGSTSSNGVSLAEDNGLWVTGPLPVPPVYNSKKAICQFFLLLLFCHTFALLEVLIFMLVIQILLMRKRAHVLF